MSGSKAKADRKIQRLTEGLAQAHNALHLEPPDVDACHLALHRAAGVPDAYDVDHAAPLAQREGFDEAFRALCVQHRCQAAYVLADSVREDGATRLLSGGDAVLCEMVDRAMRATL